MTPFLRALERTGKARAAAEDAGVDHTTAYQRRRTHAEFAAAWEEALAAHAAAKARGEEEEIGAVRAGAWTPSPGSPAASPASPPGRGRGEELVASGGRVKRAGHDRWSKRKETIFFEELAATNNIQRSAAAAGVSANAVHARRLKHPVFAAKWDAVVRAAKASIDLYTVEAARKTFDPDELDTGDVTPKVSIAEAIKIAHSGGTGGRTPQRQAGERTLEEEAEEMGADAVEEMRERLIRKLRRGREQELRDKQAAGWSYDESYDVLIPPGWVKGPDYRPKEPEEPFDFDSLYR